MFDGLLGYTVHHAVLIILGNKLPVVTVSGELAAVNSLLSLAHCMSWLIPRLAVICTYGCYILVTSDASI